MRVQPLKPRNEAPTNPNLSDYSEVTLRTRLMSCKHNAPYQKTNLNDAICMICFYVALVLGIWNLLFPEGSKFCINDFHGF